MFYIILFQNNQAYKLKHLIILTMKKIKQWTNILVHYPDNEEETDD